MSRATTQRIAVMGLGRFGSQLAINLTRAGQEVIAMDRDLDVVDELRDKVTLSIALDATDEAALRVHGIHTVDVVVVAMRSNFEASALATVMLKQMGVKRVISRAGSPTSARILAQIGADGVVNPEDESAERWCSRLTTPHFLDHFALSDEFSMIEMKPPQVWVGRSLKELNLRETFGVLVVAVKSGDGDRPEVQLPAADTRVQADALLVMVGPDAKLERLPV